MPKANWKASKDPLYRGDDSVAVSCPNPQADSSLVRHIMYFEGTGRETPYLSTTENRDIADKFSVVGSVWETTASISKSYDVKHISNKELIFLLQGKGKGAGSWSRPSEIMEARRYVMQNAEHLLDFRDVSNPKVVTTQIFKKS